MKLRSRSGSVRIVVNLMNANYRNITRQLLATLYLEAQENKMWPPPEETVDVVVQKCVHRTDKALLVVISGRQVWMPISQIRSDIDKASRAWNTEVEVTLWWVKEAKLTEYL